MSRPAFQKGPCGLCGEVGPIRKTDGLMFAHYCVDKYSVHSPPAEDLSEVLGPNWGKLPPGMGLVGEAVDRRAEAGAFTQAAREARRVAQEPGQSFGVRMALNKFARWCESQADARKATVRA